MDKKLLGKRIVIAGSRKTDEMSTLIEKQGGIPVVRSLQGFLVEDAQALEQGLRRFTETGSDWVIFTTGAGTEVLLSAATRIGIHEEFVKTIKHSKVAIRGYKTYSVLKKLGILPDVVDEDGTTRSLISALDSFQFARQKVLVQLHGEPAPELIRFLEERQAEVNQLLPYRHIAPETSILQLLCDELADGLVDAVCFTTAVQVRYLFSFAKESGVFNSVKKAFDQKVTAVAVGKVTAEALKDEGLEHFLVPESERMGAMIIELAQHYRNFSRE